MQEYKYKMIYDREYYMIPYKEMERWLAFMESLSYFTLDGGQCQIEFSDAFSRFKI